MNQIKLKPKQLAVLQQIQTQKADLQKLFQGFNEKEALILELVFEEHNIEGTITSVKLNGDSLEYELEVKQPEEARVKVKKVKQVIKE